MTSGSCESHADAVRRFAGEIERLRAGLLELGITEGAGPWPIPVSEWPVTTALAVLGGLLTGVGPVDEGEGLPFESPVFMWLVYEVCGTCGAAAKRPCVGSRFGPHPGRETRWARAARERAAGAVGG